MYNSEYQKQIQKALAGKRPGDGCLVLYGITSSCMEEEFEGSGLVAYGYNRGKKRGKKQVAVSLLCGKGGRPVAVDIFPGNTKDGATVVGKIEELQKNTAPSRLCSLAAGG
ncbi:MAG: hypothetical protein FWG10_12605 [Eubacteriaceae bacterium]|nr:hypothetical protein [Eubacteriaceae bacterium]